MPTVSSLKMDSTEKEKKKKKYETEEPELFLCQPGSMNKSANGSLCELLIPGKVADEMTGERNVAGPTGIRQPLMTRQQVY